MIVILSILFALPLVAAASLTAALAFVVRGKRTAPRASTAQTILIGSFTPFVMLAYGLYQAWPWPWSRPETMHDGAGMGAAMFVISGALIWVGCLVVSYVILRPLTKRNIR